MGWNSRSWLPNNLNIVLRAKPYRPNACLQAVQMMTESHRLQTLRLVNQSATHEAGHAIVAWQSQHVSQILEIYCDVDEGSTELGWSNHVHMNAPELWDWIAIDLAGLAAELLVFNKFCSQHSRSDLLAAKNDAIAILHSNARQQWCDEANLGSLLFERMYASSRQLTKPVVQVLNVAYRRAKALILCESNRFAKLVLQLHKNGSLESYEIEQLFGRRFPVDVP